MITSEANVLESQKIGQTFFKSLLLTLLYALLLSTKSYTKAFEPMLLSEFEETRADSQWLVSEKLDGVRGLWNGQKMYFRSGKIMELPNEFVKDFPPFALDGELYSPKLHFSQIISILKNPQKQDEILKLRFYVFDVPNSPKASLIQRLDELKSYLQSKPNAYIEIIPQKLMQGRDSIDKELQSVVNNGGEGLVLRHPNMPYQAKRSKYDFKLKTRQDAECKVIGHTQGKGKYDSMLGAIICEYNDKSFKIGSGLSDTLRQNPPPIGAIISFKFQGLTHNGIPRFPTFWRLKQEE